MKKTYISPSFLQQLVGKTITTIDNNEQSDQGFKITFNDRSTLEWGYSSCEGFTELNGEELAED